MFLKQIITVICFLLVAMSIGAEVPYVINYQGRLADVSGDPVTDGPYEIKFKIYGSPTGTDSAWSSGVQVVTVTDGLFEYKLGSAVSLHNGYFYTPTRYLGITVGTDPEMSPRVQLVSVPYAYRSEIADQAALADDAQTLAGEDPDFYLNWGDMTNVPAGFADGVDDVGTGDITGVTAGSGLTGGGVSGNVSLSVPTGGITSTHIASSAVGWVDMDDNSVGIAEMRNNAIGSAEVIDGSLHTNDIMDGSLFNIDIASLADIAITKIQGTAVNLSDPQTIIGNKTFSSNIYHNASVYNNSIVYNNDASYFGDSSMRVNDGGVTIGSPTFLAGATNLLQVQRDYNTTNNRVGIFSYQNNSGLAGHIYGMVVEAYNHDNSVGNRLGIRARAGISTNNVATSWGILSSAFGGVTAYGVYGSASGAIINYGGYFSPGHTKSPGSFAGYFNGDVGISGFSSTAGGGMKIDHPLDPANQYLIHNNVQSPDMQTIYNGNVTTDGRGSADVRLPDYFEALNSSFTYQLTVIGSFGQAIIADEISNNRFTIRTESPNVKVSWMVTGIRKDSFANSNRTSAEVQKLQHEVGLYQNPDSFGLTETESINYVHEKNIEDEDLKQ